MNQVTRAGDTRADVPEAVKTPTHEEIQLKISQGLRQRAEQRAKQKAAAQKEKE